MTIRLLLLFLLLLVSHQLMITVAIAETTTTTASTTTTTTREERPYGGGGAAAAAVVAASIIIGDDDDSWGAFSDVGASSSSSSFSDAGIVASRNFRSSSSLFSQSSSSSFSLCCGKAMNDATRSSLARRPTRRAGRTSDHRRQKHQHLLLLLLRGGSDDDNHGNGGYKSQEDEDASTGSSNSNTFHHHHHRRSSTTSSNSIPLSQDPNPSLSLEQLENSFTKEDIDQLLDEIIGTSGGIVIHKYSPSSKWLLRQTSGTFLSSNKVWISTFKNIIWSLFVITGIHYAIFGDYKIWLVPSTTSSTTTNAISIESSSFVVVVQRLLKSISIIWKSVLTPLTSFLLVIFVAQSYMFWRSIYDEIGKGLLARMNDLSLLLATTETTTTTQSTRTNKKRNTSIIESSNLFLEDIAGLLRIYHVLLWATHTRRYRVLLTEKGMSRLVSRRMMSHTEKHMLDKTCPSVVSSSQKHTILLEYIMYKCHNRYISQTTGRHQSNNDNKSSNNNNHNNNNVLTLIDQLICQLRSSSNYIIHKLRGRMVLAYIHYIEILVDIYLLLMPIALYHETGYDGIMAVTTTSLLSVLYIGLLEISKQLLDPFGNDADTSSSTNSRSCCYMDIAVLIREWNASSKRYMNIGQSF